MPDPNSLPLVRIADATGNPTNPGGSGGASGGTQAAPFYDILVSDTAGTQPLGTPADAAATSDTGTFGLIAFFKRGLTNWTTLLARIPASVSGRVPVDGSGVTQPISAGSLPLPTGAATAANQTSEITQLTTANQRTAYTQVYALSTTAGTTYTATSMDAGASPSAYTKYAFALTSSQASATNGLIVEWSTDNTNFNPMQLISVSAGVPVVGEAPIVAQYTRIRFINGATAGTLFASVAIRKN